MKQLLLFSFILVFISACSNDSGEAKKEVYSDLETELLKGNIASITETPYKVDSLGNIGEMDSCCSSNSTIDENGNYVKVVETDSKGTASSESAFERYENGMWKSARNMKDGKLTGGMNTEIDDNNMYVLAQELDSTGTPSRYYTGISQNEYAQVTGWKQYDKDSVLRQTGEAKYDSMLQASFTLKDSLGNMKSSTRYKYNDKGEMTERVTTTVTKDSTTTKKVTYTYDAHDDMGNWTQRTEYDENGKPVKIVKRTYEYRKEEGK